MSTFEELIEILTDEAEPSYSKRSAISALGRLGDERAIEPLLSALKDEDQYLRREAAGALGELGSPAAVGPLIEALEDPEEHVRRTVINSLGVLGDARAIEPLRRMMEAKSFFTRSEAEKSLRKIEELLKVSAPAEEGEAELEPSSSAPAEVETRKELSPTHRDAAEGKPGAAFLSSVPEAPKAQTSLETDFESFFFLVAGDPADAPAETPEARKLPIEETSATMPVEESELPEILIPEDSLAERAKETEERAEQLTEAKQAKRGLRVIQDFTDAERRLIQAQISEGSRNAILIRLEKGDSLLQPPSFYPGEVMRGKMLLNVAKPFKARGMYLSVKGKEEVKWKKLETPHVLNGLNINPTVYHDEYTVINKTFPILGGQRRIQAGNYEYPFEFRIPEICTPSYSGEICTCEYSVSAYIDVPLKQNIKSERSFRVSIPPTGREKRAKAISFSTTHAYHDITLSVTLQDTACPIGSRVKGTITFQNHTKRRVRGIDVGLFYREYAQFLYKRPFDFGEKRRIPEPQIDTIRISVPEETIRRFRTGFSLKIPDSASQTGSRHLFDAGAFVKVNLDLARELDVSCSHRIDILPD